MSLLSAIRASAAYSPSFRSFTSNTSRIVKLEPGLVHIKRGLPFAEEMHTTQLVMQRGLGGKNGFWKHDENGNKVFNSRPYRGRFYDALETSDEIDQVLSNLCLENLQKAAAYDSTLKVIQPTHLLALVYKTLKIPPKEGFMPWHRDNGDNDGDGTTPVVSFSLGDSCDFLICHEKPKITKTNPPSNPLNLAHRIRFESGDALIFGGPCRNIWHAIYQIHPNTSPSMLENKRFNLTFRFTPGLKGREAEFATVPADQLSKDNQFFKLTQM